MATSIQLFIVYRCAANYVECTYSHGAHIEWERKQNEKETAIHTYKWYNSSILSCCGVAYFRHHISSSISLFLSRFVILMLSQLLARSPSHIHWHSHATDYKKVIKSATNDFCYQLYRSPLNRTSAPIRKTSKRAKDAWQAQRKKDAWTRCYMKKKKSHRVCAQMQLFCTIFSIRVFVEYWILAFIIWIIYL